MLLEIVKLSLQENNNCRNMKKKFVSINFY